MGKVVNGHIFRLIFSALKFKISGQSYKALYNRNLQL